MATPAESTEYTAEQRHAIENFASVGRLSDFVKGLNTFDGKPTDLVSWISDVEGLFCPFQPFAQGIC